jgi:hypothetical protein
MVDVSVLPHLESHFLPFAFFHACMAREKKQNPADWQGLSKTSDSLAGSLGRISLCLQGFGDNLIYFALGLPLFCLSQQFFALFP